MAGTDFRDEEMAEAQPQRTSNRKQKGRGFQERDAMELDDDRTGHYDTSSDSSKGGPIKSVESWVIFVSGVQEEAQEEDLVDIFGEYGEMKNVHLNLDRRTGYVKGYAIIEYGERAEAEAAISNLNGRPMLEQALHVDWAFSAGPKRKGRR
ncbi:hypothetical protein ABBQ32_013800 [Trebouxia sp. C0010 RCD-2024]